MEIVFDTLRYAICARHVYARLTNDRSNASKVYLSDYYCRCLSDSRDYAVRCALPPTVLGLPARAVHRGPLAEGKRLLVWRLIHHEPGFIYGGAAVYIWSVIPTFYALSYQLLPSPAAVFLFLHLVNYLLVGIVAWLVFSIATDHLKMRPGTAALTAAAVLI